jgi:hypothetical protein
VKKDLSTITCYKCKQKGHYADKCTEKSTWELQQTGATKVCRKPNEKTPQGVANIETNCSQLVLVIDVERLCKSNAQLNGNDVFLMRWQTQGIAS